MIISTHARIWMETRSASFTTRKALGHTVRPMIVTRLFALRVEPPSMPITACGTSLLRHVFHVVGVRACEQMPNAQPVVASVKNHEGKGINPEADKVRYPMSGQRSGWMHEGKFPIAMPADVAGPDPALAVRAMAGGLVNIVPKALGLLRCQFRNWFRMVTSHVVSLLGDTVRAASVFPHRCGPLLNFTALRSEILCLC